MKIFLYLFYFSSVSLFLIEKADAQDLSTLYDCSSPFWSAPAESYDGVFTGDLSLACWISGESISSFDINQLRQMIAIKIQSDSTVHQGPDLNSGRSNSLLVWDLSHRFEEDGNSIQIREILELSTPSQTKLKYQTHSKDIKASGMASYLKSIEFTMIVQQDKSQLNVSFRNRVQVERPWYALDLIFTSIAKNICLKKMNHVRDKFMPWLLSEKFKKG